MAARASAGIAYCLSTENVTLELVGCGSILSIVPTPTPRMRISSPTNRPLAFTKYAEYVFLSTSFHSFLPTRNEERARVKTKLTAVTRRRVLRLTFTGSPLRRALARGQEADPARGRAMVVATTAEPARVRAGRAGFRLAGPPTRTASAGWGPDTGHTFASRESAHSTDRGPSLLRRL